MKRLGTRTLLLLALTAITLPGGAAADQSSQPTAPAAGHLSIGRAHSCVVLSSLVRCWGFGGNGRLGNGTATIGDDETPGTAAPAGVGPVKAISAGDGHTCAILTDDTVRCWGFGGNGRLGYGNVDNIGDDEPPGAGGPVDLGGHKARAISAGGSHTCAVLDDNTVRCWGYGATGQLGYGVTTEFEPGVFVGIDVGDNETPGSRPPVELGAGRTATAITAGENHTCAILDNGTVKCWGYATYGQLGYGNGTWIGDDETPASAGPVNLGGQQAKAISAGGQHTCAVLDGGTVRCWGTGTNGQLGYGNRTPIGDDEPVASAGPVDLGPRAAQAISAGREHTCALLDDSSVRCWGSNEFGQLGYGNRTPIGDDETPAAAPAVALGGPAIAVDASWEHTCAQLQSLSVRCWGYGANGRLGLCTEASLGDDEAPTAANPVDLGGGEGCWTPTVRAADTATPPPPGPPTAAADVPAPAAPATPPDPQADEDARALALRSCMRTAAARRTKTARARARRACLTRHGRTPGRVPRVRARARSRTKVELTFNAVGSDGRRPPAAHTYLIRQSLRPIRSARSFSRAPALCRGSCRFDVSRVGTKITLTVTGLRPRTTYYYAIAARDNVSGRLGPRSATARIRTR